MSITVKKIFQEPLVGFAIIAALLFSLFSVVQGSSAPDKKLIHISANTLAVLANNYQRVWNRPPGQQELDNLVDNYIREEILYREALALGLDQSDAVVRMRLVRKMEFMVEDVAEIKEPDEAQLRQYYQDHRENYAAEPIASFNHLYFSFDRHGNATEAAAEQALRRLHNGVQVSAVDSDSYHAGASFARLGKRDLLRSFGERFAAAVLSGEAGKWIGPIASGYGFHLVLISEKTPGKTLDFAQVEQEVYRDYMAWQQQRSNQQVFARIRDQYQITKTPELSKDTVL